MSEVFFTSDTHYLHKNILKFCPCTRHGEDEREMTELMIEAHNKVVKPGDVVYHLGDVAFGNKEEAIEIIGRLNGKIHLILGNHDDWIPKTRNIGAMFASIQQALFTKINGRKFYLHHYACRVWRDSHHGSYHLYGHSHGDLPSLGKAMDVGIDARPLGDMMPWSYDEVIETIAKREEENASQVSQ